MNEPANLDSTSRPPLHRRMRFWILILAILFIFFILKESGLFNAKPAAKKQPVAVVLAKARKGDLPIFINALGAVTPTYSITVRTQINGTLLHVYYREGQIVKAGELLAEIDPRPYQAQLLQYQGQLVRDKALLANALIDLKRYQTLWKQDSISQQTLATQKSLVTQYYGAIKIDQGLIAGVKVNLSYTQITAPVDGRIGLRLVDPGNFVQTSDTNGIAVVNTFNPITIIYTIPEDNLSDVIDKIYSGTALPVSAYDRQQTKLLATGTVSILDNQIDPTTGTVRLRAQFTNDQNQLFPSQFVNIRMLVKILLNATIVPTAAIQYTAQGSRIFVLNNNMTVTDKPVKVGVTVDDESTILSGILPGQSVVIEGADNLRDGTKIRIAKRTVKVQKQIQGQLQNQLQEQVQKQAPGQMQNQMQEQIQKQEQIPNPTNIQIKAPTSSSPEPVGLG